MLMIGKCNEVFWLCNDKIPDLLSAPTKKEYNLVKKNTLLRYIRYKKFWSTHAENCNQN